MKLIDGKSVLLGFGLGIIMTSILAIIFFAGNSPQLSDAEIIERAEEIGMVDRYEMTEDILRDDDGTVSFIIKENETYAQISNRLYEAGIIESSIEFDIMIKKGNLEDAIKSGEYQISLHDDTKTIVEIMTE